MSKHSDLYDQVREEIVRWPQWKIDAYNDIFATSAHAERVTPHIPTNADRIRSMNDEELAEFLWEQNGNNRYWKSVGKYLDWLKAETEGTEI